MDYLDEEFPVSPAPHEALASVVRRRLVLLGGASFLVAPLGLLAQGNRVYRIGLLSSGFPPSPLNEDPLRKLFVQQLEQLGYLEGKNLIIDARYSQTDDERLPDLAADLLRHGV